MADRITAEQRLERILHVLAAASCEEGATLGELATALGASEEEVLRCIEEATARAFYQSAGSGDAVQILIEGDRVRVWAGDDFRRPVRLSPREALALELGLRLLAAETHAERRQDIFALIERLTAQLAAPALWTVAAAPPDATRVGQRRWGTRTSEAPISYHDQDGISLHRSVPPTLPGGDRDPRGPRPGAFDAEQPDWRPEEVEEVLAEAQDQRLHCRIEYLKPSDVAPESRLIAPYQLVHASGRWYLIAYDTGREDMRVFRVDRVLDAQLTDRSFHVPADFDARPYLRRFGAPFTAPDAEAAWVRYSPRVAAWVAESTGTQAEPDGSLVVRHDVADPEWLVRHVLRYGSDAEVLRPASLRRRVGDAARRLAARP